MKNSTAFSRKMAVLLGMLLGLFAVAAAQVSVSPTTQAFGNVSVGKVSSLRTFTVSYSGKGQATITNVAVTPPEYVLITGQTPVVVNGGMAAHYQVQFQPDVAGSFNGTMTITLDNGQSPLVVTFTGNGTSTAGKITLDKTNMDFGAVPVGSTSAAQTVTLTNTGTAAVTVNPATLSPMEFIQTGATKKFTLTPGQSDTVMVTLSPDHIGTYTGTLDLQYATLSDNGVSLTGSGVAASAFSIATLANLPTGTQSAAYYVPLQTAGPAGTVTWSLVSGSTLPPGLTLSSSGILSGTLNGAALTTYKFALSATDSITNSAPRRTYSLVVSAATGANCNDDMFSATDGSGLLTPLDALGTGLYQGFQAGLYPGGVNTRPASFEAFGVAQANAIQALDGNGNPSPTGKYVLLAIGSSTEQKEMQSFSAFFAADPSKNPKLVFVSGAQGGETVGELMSSTSSYWNSIINSSLPSAGATANQVVAVELEAVDSLSSSFPADAQQIQGEIETVMQIVLTKFPNTKLMYLSPRIYGGYSNGIVTTNPEPWAYEIGFANKWVLADQINGVASINYDPAKGPVLAPWASWANYYWTNGMVPNAANLLYTCQDINPDGTHPNIGGKNKVAQALLNFFKTDVTATPWFLAH